MTEQEYEAYTDYITETLLALLAVDSPTGYTDDAAEFVLREFKALGYAPQHLFRFDSAGKRL